MARRVHGPLKIISFNANGIGRQCHELSKQLQDLRLDAALFSETNLKPHERYFLPNYHVYSVNCYQGRKGRNAVTVRKGILTTM
jgi:exonuclease III